MNKLFLITAKCVNQNSSIIEISKDDLKIYLCDLMDYTLENKPEILDVMSFEDVRKLMLQNAIEWLESSFGMLECGTFAIYNLNDISEIDLDEIPYLYDLDDLLCCEEVEALDL